MACPTPTWSSTGRSTSCMRTPMIRSATPCRARPPAPASSRPGPPRPRRARQRPRPPSGGPGPGPPLLARDVVDQDVLAQAFRRDEEGPALVDPGHLVHELGQVGTPLQHEGVDDDPVAGAVPDLAQGLLDGAE